MKICSKCKRELPETEEYFYKSKNKTGYRLMAECKECARERTINNYQDPIKNQKKKEYMKIWREGNINEVAEYDREYYKKNGKHRREKAKEFLRKNPEKAKEYQVKRKLKNHDISKTEWIYCKEYFNNCCAYCGLPIEEHYRSYNENPKNIDFHKEHAVYNGPNDLSNCVPSCQSCNSEKNVKSLEFWYNPNNPKFSEERYNKLIQWLQGDYLRLFKN
jgi:hypothetical protein